MKIQLSVLLILLISSTTLASSTPQVSSGRLEIVNQFESKYIGPRTFFVWLPNNYDKSRPTSVLYMHDGQMLFDASTTWNQQEWGVDEVAGQLIAEGRLRSFIVVGIENAGAGRRGPEYFPQNAVRYIKDKRVLDQHAYLEKELNANNYLKFLVRELKPYLADKYSVSTDKAHSFLAGSSMGGLISMYAISEYPEEFAAAACLSTHWPGSMPPESTEFITQALLEYMQDKLPDSKSHRLYFDYGTKTLDSYYPPLQKRVDEILRAKGYDNTNWITKEFAGADHSEKSWRERLDVPLLFLLGK